MKANYHTHTARCGHASGTDESYVRAALSQGYEELGFSDHMPWPYKTGYTNPRVRMTLDRMGEYLASVRALKEKYAGQIRVLAGFECEYFPQYMTWLQEVKAREALDYLILGNHFAPTDETGGAYYGSCKTAALLRDYVENTIRGLETGLFAYLAHPDLFMRSYGRFDADCRAAARDLSQACSALSLPMEYNLHDRYIAHVTHRVSYPHPEFFDVAAANGARIIVGIDAHEPQELSDPTQWNRAQAELAAYGDLVIGQIGRAK